MNQNVETKNKQKTISDFLFKEAPEAAISGLYKGMESGVGILSDYVENPARNISFDVATAGFGKGLKFLGATGLISPKLFDDAFHFFRGVDSPSTEKALSKLIDDKMLVGGGKKIWGDAAKFPKSTYATLFPRYAQGYAKNLDLGGIMSKRKLGNPGTIFRFKVPETYIYEVNKEASEEIARRVGQKSFDPDYYSNIIDAVLRDKGGLVQGNLNVAGYPFKDDLAKLAKIAADDPKGKMTNMITRGTYRFREGIPIKFLDDYEFVPGANTSQATIKRLNDAIRKKEIMDILKSL